MAACRSLKIAYQSAPPSLSIVSIACLASVGLANVQAVNRVATRSVIGPRTDWESSRRAIAYCFCLIARTPSTSRARGSVLSICRTRSASFTASSTSPFCNTAKKVRPRQLVVAGIAPQGSAIIGGGGGRILLGAGMAGGEIAARSRNTGQVRRSLRPSRDDCGPSDGECGHCGHRRTPDGWRKDHGCRLHLADKRFRRGRAAQNGLFGPRPQ